MNEELKKAIMKDLQKLIKESDENNEKGVAEGLRLAKYIIKINIMLYEDELPI